jgi:hypothetical protein
MKKRCAIEVGKDCKRANRLQAKPKETAKQILQNA